MITPANERATREKSATAQPVSNMRVCLVAQRLPPDTIGGIESHIADLTNALRNLGMHVSLANTGLPDASASLVRIAPLLKLRPFDVIHVHGYTRLLYAAIAALRPGRKRIATLHGGLWSPLFNFDLTSKIRHNFDKACAVKLLSVYDIIVATTMAERDALLKFGISEKKIAHIPLAIHPLTLSTQREAYALVIGRIVPRKGIERAIRFMSRLEWPIDLRIVGPQLDVEYCKSLLTLASKVGGGNRVHIEAAVAGDTKDHVIGSASVLLQLSEWDSFGLVILEALTAGVAVLNNGAGGKFELMSYPNVFSAQTDEQATESWKTIFSLPAAERQELAMQGRQRVLERHSWPVIARHIAALYS